MFSKSLRNSFIGLLLATLMILAQGPPVLACGGFFCTTAPIDQSAERIIFTVNGDGTITAIVGIGYIGEAEDFSWVVPVPSPPELDVTETQTLDSLMSVTNPLFVRPRHYCQGLIAPCCGGGGGGNYYEKGQVGPYDFAIVGSDEPNELVTWLRENQYQVTPEMEPIIAHYVNEGMYFLALRLSQNTTVGDIKPIVMTYQSEKPMIPIRLTAIAAVDPLPIYVWIFADTRYVPENYAQIEFDPSLLRNADHTVQNMSNPTVSLFRYPSPVTVPYQAQVREKVRVSNGHAFITELAMPTQELLAIEERLIGQYEYLQSAASVVPGDPTLRDLFSRFAYVTRLYTAMSPSEMTIDPVFMPDPTAPTRSPIVEMDEAVNGLAYWGCSTRTAIDALDMTALPERHTWPEEQLTVAYPEGWILSTLETANKTTAFIFSPESVDEQTLADYWAGQAVPAMFVILPTPYEQWLVGDYIYDTRMQPDIQLRLALNDPEFSWETAYNTDAPVLPTRLRFSLEIAEQVYFPEELVIVGLLTSDEDWSANAKRYEAMLDYAVSRDFYHAPDLQHTLFLTGDFVYSTPGDTVVELPYPAEWRETVNSAGEIVITPADTPEVMIRALDYNDLAALLGIERRSSWRDWASEDWQRLVDWVETNYILTSPDSQVVMKLSALWDEKSPLFSLPFANEERQGWVLFTHGYLVEISAPVERYREYESLFETIISHVRSQVLRKLRG